MPSIDLPRLARYGVSGVCSALTHIGVLTLLVRGFGTWPVTASTVGFAASVLVSYLLQRGWVFRSAQGHVAAGAKFLTVTGVAFAVNTAVLWTGTGPLHLPYQPVQVAALVAIPLVNYTLNARWTFRG